MKRWITMMGCVAMVALLVVACGGQEQAAVDETAPAKTALKVAKAEEVVAAIEVVEGENPQVNCPIMGNPVDKTCYVDKDDKRIYFCCPPCIEKFNEDADGFIKKMEDEGITLAKLVECTHDHDHGDHGHDHDHGDHGHDHDHGDHDHAGHDHG
jgi:hypothetical protein